MPKLRINCWWCCGDIGNFGDALTPLILRKLGYDVNFVGRKAKNKFMGAGSIANASKAGDVVWGSGIIKRCNKPLVKGVNYLAVRGPITGDKVGCFVYGDPGLLCSKLWPKKTTGKNKLGVITHYADYNKHDTGDIEQINTLSQDPLTVIDKLVTCDRVVSSSLHGIIVAHSYGIPAGWWRPSRRLNGFLSPFPHDAKFKDYAMSVGIDLKPNHDYAKVDCVLPDMAKVLEIQDSLLRVLREHMKDSNCLDTNFGAAKQYLAYKKKQGLESLCGDGSYLSNATDVIDFTQQVINDYDIKSILDLGCGDWNWFSRIELDDNTNYIGWDCDQDMLKSNNDKYGSDNVKFELKDIVTTEFPVVDLIICRDVLFHLPQHMTIDILTQVKNKCKYFLTTSFLGETTNGNPRPYLPISGWGFYRINLDKPPYNLLVYRIKDVVEKANGSRGKQRSVCLYDLSSGIHPN